MRVADDPHVIRRAPNLPDFRRYAVFSDGSATIVRWNDSYEGPIVRWNGSDRPALSFVHFVATVAAESEVAAVAEVLGGDR